MQRVKATIAIYNPQEPRRQFGMNFWLNYYAGFSFDYDFWNTVFWYLRLGKVNIGAQRLTFTDATSGLVLLDLRGNDVPERMTGYWHHTCNQVLSVGVKVRLQYNEGRDVYRTFPTMLDERFFQPSERDELLELSYTFWNAYGGFWQSELDKYVNQVFDPGSLFHFSQEDYPSRRLVSMSPFSVGLERRFRWITQP